MNSDGKEWKWFHIGSFVTGLYILAITGYTFVKVLQDGGSFGVLAVLIMVSLTALIGIMNLLTYAAKRTGIADAKQAFGLPEGSVRAILTMAFIVLVGILASYLMVNSGEQSPYSRTAIAVARNVNLAAALELKKTYDTADGLVLIARSPGPQAQADDCLAICECQKRVALAAPRSSRAEIRPAPASSAPTQPTPGNPPTADTTPDQQGVNQPPPGPVAPKPPEADPSAAAAPQPAAAAEYDVCYYPKVDHRLGEDISKQILTMLSTILAAMIGFYFGARPGEGDTSAARRAGAVAKIETIVSRAPKIDEIEKKAENLAAKAAGNPDQLAKVKALQQRLALAKDDLNAAAAARLSPEITADQMQEKAAQASNAEKVLQGIASELAEAEQQQPGSA